MDLTDYRKQIDAIDDEILRLFKERMDVSLGIAAYKKEHALPALDAAREREKLNEIGEKAGEDIRSYAYMLYSTLFELSRAHQGRLLHPPSALNKTIEDASTISAAIRRFYEENIWLAR